MNDLMPLPATGPTADFYNNWIDYLNPMPHLLLSIVQQIFHSITEFLYAMGMGTLDAWEGAWKLADFAQIFTQAGKQADQTGFHVAQWIPMFLTLGLILFAVVMAIQLLMFVITAGKRGLEWPKGVIIIFLVIGFTPMLMSSGLQIAQSVNSTIMQKNKKDPMVKILQHNSVDLKLLARHDFNVRSNQMDQYRPLVQDPTLKGKRYVNNPIFTTDMANKQNLKKLSDTQKKVFTNKLNFDDTHAIMPLDKGGWLTGGALGETYPRVKVNWIGVMAAFIVFTISVFLAIVELLLRFYRLAYYSLTMLFFSFREASGKKAVQMMQLMEGSIVGAGLMPLSVILFFAFIQYGINVAGNLNLSWWPYTVLVIAILLAGMKGLMSGFSLIDQWTGVPTGQASAAQSAIAAMMGGKMAASAAKTMGKGAASGASAVRDGLKQKINAARDASDEISRQMHADLKNGDVPFGRPPKSIDGMTPQDYMKKMANSNSTENGESDSKSETEGHSRDDANTNNTIDNATGRSDTDSGDDGEGLYNGASVPLPSETDNSSPTDASPDVNDNSAQIPFPEEANNNYDSPDGNSSPFADEGATRVPLPGTSESNQASPYENDSGRAERVPIPPINQNGGTSYGQNDGTDDVEQLNNLDNSKPDIPTPTETRIPQPGNTTQSNPTRSNNGKNPVTSGAGIPKPNSQSSPIGQREPRQNEVNPKPNLNILSDTPNSNGSENHVPLQNEPLSASQATHNEEPTTEQKHYVDDDIPFTEEELNELLPPIDFHPVLNLGKDDDKK